MTYHLMPARAIWPGEWPASCFHPTGEVLNVPIWAQAGGWGLLAAFVLSKLGG